MDTADHISSRIASLVCNINPLPVLVDVGASAETPCVWRPLAAHSVYVGFDPDLREMRRENGGQFHQAFVLNQAVTPDPSAASVTFRLTRAPQCSSTLRPNRTVLDNYPAADRFDVVRETAVPATTLDVALENLSLAGVDWLKLDTQGTDLRLFNSLAEGTRNRLLAVDAEPGLRGAYESEDQFGDLHAELIRRGFWCAAATVKGLPRVRPATLRSLMTGFEPPAAERPWEASAETAAETLAAGGTRVAVEVEQDAADALSPCPGWIECRYLRTVESIDGADQRSHILLWAFAIAAGHPGFAGDVAMQYGRRFGPDADWRAMAAGAAALLQSAARQRRAAQARQRGLMGQLRRRVRRLINGVRHVPLLRTMTVGLLATSGRPA